MIERRNKLTLSRARWTLARYLTTRALAPASPVARADDDLLHVVKLAVAVGLARAVYVVDDDDRYLGVISDERLMRRVFEHLDPSLYVSEHGRATTGLINLGQSVMGLTAGALMETGPRPLRDGETVSAAMRALHHARRDELPVINDAGKLLGVIRAVDILREWVEDTLLTAMGDETESFY